MAAQRPTAPVLTSRETGPLSQSLNFSTAVLATSREKIWSAAPVP